MTYLSALILVAVGTPLVALAIVLISIAGLYRDYKRNDDSIVDRYLDSQAPDKKEPPEHVDG